MTISVAKKVKWLYLSFINAGFLKTGKLLRCTYFAFYWIIFCVIPFVSARFFNSLLALSLSTFNYPQLAKHTS